MQGRKNKKGIPRQLDGAGEEFSMRTFLFSFSYLSHNYDLLEYSMQTASNSGKTRRAVPPLSRGNRQT